MRTLLTRLEASLAGRPALPADAAGEPARAAVSITFRSDRDEPEFLLIRRSIREGDPWSGQVALPGGRWEPRDPDLAATAMRETWEETGIDIAHHGRIIGALDELRPRSPLLPPIVVTPFVAHLEQVGPLSLSGEVASAFWVPWSRLLDPSIDQVREVTSRGASWRVPSFTLDEHVVWGMTERILRQLISRIHEGGSA